MNEHQEYLLQLLKDFGVTLPIITLPPLYFFVKAFIENFKICFLVLTIYEEEFAFWKNDV